MSEFDLNKMMGRVFCNLCGVKVEQQDWRGMKRVNFDGMEQTWCYSCYQQGTAALLGMMRYVMPVRSFGSSAFLSESGAGIPMLTIPVTAVRPYMVAEGPYDFRGHPRWAFVCPECLGTVANYQDRAAVTILRHLAGHVNGVFATPKAALRNAQTLTPDELRVGVTSWGDLVQRRKRRKKHDGVHGLHQPAGDAGDSRPGDPAAADAGL